MLLLAQYRSLYYVETGNVIVLPKMNARQTSVDFLLKGSTSIGQDLVFGSGQFLSISNFIMGEDTFAGETERMVAYAYSDTVTMRVWTMPEEEDGLAPLHGAENGLWKKTKKESKKAHRQLAPLSFAGLVGCL